MCVQLCHRAPSHYSVYLEEGNLGEWCTFHRGLPLADQVQVEGGQGAAHQDEEQGDRNMLAWALAPSLDEEGEALHDTA